MSSILNHSMSRAGQVIRMVRGYHRPKLTQQALAKSFGITRDRVASYELGRAEAPADLIELMAQRWRLPMAIFSGDEPPSKEEEDVIRLAVRNSDRVRATEEKMQGPRPGIFADVEDQFWGAAQPDFTGEDYVPIEVRFFAPAKGVGGEIFVPRVVVRRLMFAVEVLTPQSGLNALGLDVGDWLLFEQRSRPSGSGKLHYGVDAEHQGFLVRFTRPEITVLHPAKERLDQPEFEVTLPLHMIGLLVAVYRPYGLPHIVPHEGFELFYEPTGWVPSVPQHDL